MNNTKSKSISAILLATMSTILAIQNSCNAQSFRINNNGKTGYGFKTTAGTFTAMHVGGINADLSIPEMDIEMNSSMKTPHGFKTSDLPPAFFIDRRGTRHTLNAIGSSGHQTIVSIRFFPGESGLPIFAKDGTACGVVLGNIFKDRKWSGRISRIHPLYDFAQQE